MHLDLTATLRAVSTLVPILQIWDGEDRTLGHLPKASPPAAAELEAGPEPSPHHTM